MKEIGTIKIQQREASKSRASKRLRRESSLPGVIYAKDMDSLAITLKKDEFTRTISKFGRNAGYKLVQPDGRVHTVIIKNIQIAPMTNDYIHVEFKKISFTDKINVNIPILINGRELLDSKEILTVKHIEQIAVTGLPQNIPDHVSVDVSDKQIGDSILLSDIILPEGIVTDADPDLKIISFTKTKKHISEDNAEETVEADEDNKAEEQNNPSDEQ